jgi:hypothetical protein
MKTYELFGGGHIKAASYFALASAMRRESHTPTDSLQEFMDQTAYRCKIQRGSEIRTGEVDLFIEDLIANGFIKEV